MISHPFGDIVHIIAQDFYLLYQRHEKNQTVKITVLFSISTKKNPSINIPIVSKNSRYIYIYILYNNSESTAVINSNQFVTNYSCQKTEIVSSSESVLRICCCFNLDNFSCLLFIKNRFSR